MAQNTTDTPVLDLITRMNADSLETSNLDPATFMLARIAALVAVDAPPMSYLANLAVAGEVDVTDEQVRDVLVAVAPIVGTPKVVAAAGNIMRGIGLAIDIGDPGPAGGDR